MTPSVRYCPHCGFGNEPNLHVCTTCQQPLDVEENNRVEPVPLWQSPVFLSQSPVSLSPQPVRRQFMRYILLGGGVVMAAVTVGSCVFAASYLAQPRYHGVAVMSPEMQTQQARLETFTYARHTAPITTVSWSPDGLHIAAGSADKTVHVFSAMGGSLRYIFEGYTQPVTATAWSDDSMCIVSAGESDGTAQVWEALHDKQEGEHHGQSGRVLALSWAGKNIASGAEDGTVEVWSEDGDHATSTTYKGHKGSVRAVVYDRDKLTIASGGDDGTVQIWNGSTGVTIAILKGHTARERVDLGDDERETCYRFCECGWHRNCVGYRNAFTDHDISAA